MVCPAPARIDILMSVDGVRFEEAWEHRFETTFGEEPACFLSREDLIKNKLASGRPMDLLDVERLRQDSKSQG